MRDKSRVVAQGFTQTFGVNYDETYAPVSQLASLQTICMIAAQNDWPIYQMEVYNAYVNADLEEPIYMQQPPEYIKQNNQHVLKLKKAMYSLKQSGQAVVIYGGICNGSSGFVVIKLKLFNKY